MTMIENFYIDCKDYDIRGKCYDFDPKTLHLAKYNYVPLKSPPLPYQNQNHAAAPHRRVQQLRARGRGQQDPHQLRQRARPGAQRPPRLFMQRLRDRTLRRARERDADRATQRQPGLGPLLLFPGGRRRARRRKVLGALVGAGLPANAGGRGRAAPGRRSRGPAKQILATAAGRESGRGGAGVRQDATLAVQAHTTARHTRSHGRGHLVLGEPGRGGRPQPWGGAECMRIYICSFLSAAFFSDSLSVFLFW